jgi:tetratricopeptide (TPR) repeat protein
MAPRECNDRLSLLLLEAGLSRKGFARAVQAEARAGGDEISADHTAVSRWVSGTRPRPRTVDHIASVLSARLGRHVTGEDMGWSRSTPCPAELGLIYHENVGGTLADIEGLLSADLAQNVALRSAPAYGAAWAEVALRWLVRGEDEPSTYQPDGRRVGADDVVELRRTTQLFSRMDDQFGGGHGRRAVAEFLGSVVGPLLRGRCTEATGQDLFSAAAEAVHLLAWMSYDAGVHGMAQRYFVQSLRLAQGGHDVLLAASTLDAMSHQANYLGRHREAVSLARAAVAGMKGSATPAVTAHCLMMEARALATAGDVSGTERALTQAASEFERRRRIDEPEWIRYFDDAEMTNEIAHCYRDLGQGERAASAARDGLSGSPRSNFFLTMVQADSLLIVGSVDEACSVADGALRAGENLRSERCVEYLRQFQVRLSRTPCRVATDFTESCRGNRLWLASAEKLERL